MLANAETLFRKGLGLSWLVRPGEQHMNKTGRTAMHQHAGTDSAMSMEPLTTVGFQKGCVFMKKFLLLLSLLFLSLGSVATVALARANVATQQSTAVAAEVACDAATPTPTPAHSTACGNVLYQQAVADLGVGKGVCYFDGQYTVNSKGCDGLEPPPINECNTTALTSTLDIVHEVLAVIPVGTVGRLFVFKTDAGGCGSVWTAYHDEGGTHLVNDVSIVDQSELTTEHGLDGTDKTKSVNGWESTFMLGYVPGVHYHAQVTVDGSTTAQVDVTA